MKWPVVKLSDVLERIEAGKSPQAQERPANAGEYGVLKLSAISWGSFRPSENKALLPGTAIEGFPCVSAGDLLLSRANTTELIGAVVLVKHDHSNLLLSDKTLRLVSKPAVGHPPYLLYALRTRLARNHIEQNATGTSFSMRNISQAKLVETPIPLPPLAEQRRIAEVLDRAEALRAKRRAALAQLDSLTQSLFIDHFGDPIKNPKCFPIQPMIELIDPERPISYGILMPGPEQEVGVKYVRVVDMKNGGIEQSGIRKTTETISNTFRRSLLKTGDLLMSIRGHVGRFAVVPPELEGANITQDTARLAVTGASSVFVRECLRAEGFQRWMAKHTKGVAVRGINLGDVKQMPIMLPPRSLQDNFAQQASAVEKLKAAQRASLVEMDALFASLQHRAFRGEL